MKIWKDDEVKFLFAEVEKCKVENRPLREAFFLHAQKFQRKPNSVRNYYYADVENLAKDQERAERLGVDVSLHQKKHFTAFDKVAEGELFENVKNLVDEGMSVRAACQKLSGGNLTEMTRIQNKYQNMLRKLQKPSNIVQFKQNSISDSEIDSLFLGLVKLVKKTAWEQAQKQLVASAQEFENLEAELVKLRHENVLLKRENEVLNLRLNGKKEALESHLSAVRQKKSDEGQKELDIFGKK